MKQRRGFALLTVLWLLATLSIPLAVTFATLETSIQASRNRDAAVVAGWQARTCLSELTALLNQQWLTVEVDADLWWRSVDRVASSLRGIDACHLTVEPSGVAVPLLRSEAPNVLATLRSLGVTADEESARQVILCARQGRAMVRCVGDTVATASFVADSGRIAVWHASPAVLSAVPGLSESEAHALTRAREFWPARPDRREVLLPLLDDAGDFARLERWVEWEPTFWELTATATAGDAMIRRSERWRLIRDGQRLVIGARRTW